MHVVNPEQIVRRQRNIENLDKRFSTELAVLLKECVLWDTNIAFLDSPTNPTGCTASGGYHRSFLAGLSRTSFLNGAAMNGSRASIINMSLGGGSEGAMVRTVVPGKSFNQGQNSTNSGKHCTHPTNLTPFNLLVHR